MFLGIRLRLKFFQRRQSGKPLSQFSLRNATGSITHHTHNHSVHCKNNHNNNNNNFVNNAFVNKMNHCIMFYKKILLQNVKFNSMCYLRL